MALWQYTSVPEPAELERRMKVLAGLDIILCEEDWLRVHRYDPEWTKGAALGTVDNGAGDELHVIFAEAGTLIRGFDHESPLSPHAREEYGLWPGMYDGLPAALRSCMEAGEWDEEEITFCLWRLSEASSWETGVLRELDSLEDEADAAGGASFLFGFLAGTPEAYADWAQTYFDEAERPLPLGAVARIYAGEAVTEALIKELNPQRDSAEALEELQRIGLV